MNKFLACIILLLSIGCANLSSSYVEGDIKTYNAVAPELVEVYQEIDDPVVRRIKLNTIRTWTSRIQEALLNEDLASLRSLLDPVEIEEIQND